VPAPAKLSVATQPSATTVSLVGFAVQPVVELLDISGDLFTTMDASGNTFTNDAPIVTVELSAGAGTLSTTLTATLVAGVATFSNLTIDLAGVDKVLRFTAHGRLLTQDSSPVFNITVGPATHLVLTTAPTSAMESAVAFTQQPVITIQDVAGNTRLADTLVVTAALSTGTGTLNGSTAVAASAGVATFTDLSLDLVGTDKVLTFASSNLTSVTTSALTITFVIGARLFGAPHTMRACCSKQLALVFFSSFAAYC
jgi:hypothetical protein